ncbi:glycerol kinase GlpK [Spongiivirga citrea]|uniref:Glycerol kinase n=1 Tax=Spongiivirga citrea TaxID=1481457 RepID=A0A6M0CIY5_9FLAO|nr:glycerol kinase GlpK [Spongiivirga citrea]NER15899.1 glycerol kinase GlpK [Spongiivirga citrea]
MKKKYVIAFDQGTTSTRAIIFDVKGNIVAISQKELKQHYPKSGWVEHDANEIYADQLAAFKNVMKDSGISPEEVAAIGITNQRETTVVWDRKTGEPIHNAIVWLDKRTTDICDDIKAKGLEDYIRENTGLVVDSYFSGTKLKWILDNVEGAQEKAEAGDLLFGTIDSWLIYKFTGNHLTDHTNVSRTMIYNIKDLTWDETMLKALNIPKSLLPKVQASSSDFGSVEYKGHKIPIYGVAGDQQASLFGQGGFKSGIAKNTYGTGCFMLLNTGKKHVVSKNGLLTTLTASLNKDEVKYALEGSIFVGGASIQWLRDQLKVIKKASETEAICNSIPPLQDLYVVPAFAGLGAPYWDANAKGAVYGLTLDSGREELIKATVEALAYQTRDVIDAMMEDSGKQMTTLKVDGGACANNYLMQFQSDILNVEVDRPKMLEVTALGAAFLAGIKQGIWSLEDIESVREAERIFKPEMKSKQRKQKYKGWLKAVDRTRSTKTKKKAKAHKFSILNRENQLKKLATDTFDLIVIGGGVTGSGIALDAAARGMKVCLVEKNDFASGTSNKSTKLIHGGLRYLKQLEIGLVKESGSERAIVHKLAPHLVVPEKMLLPLVEGGTYGKVMTSIGLKVYDFLANVEGNDRRKMLDKEETISKEPLLDESTLLGGGYYAEYRTDDARLTIELLKKATEFGATVINYCEMEEFVYDNEGKVKSVNCVDHNTGTKLNITARKFVSAAGPWVDLLRKKDHSMNNKYLHHTKGVHIVFPAEKLPIKQSVYFDVPDGRMIFAIPRGRVTYVGTTDTNYKGNLDRVVATKDDAIYLLDAVNATFPTVNVTIDDIESNWAGLRPLIHEEEKDPSELSRKDEIFVSDTGLISIAGGKLTGYRKMAHRTIDAVLKTMSSKRRDKFKKSKTEKIPLTSPALTSMKEVNAYQKELETRLGEIGIDNAYFAWYLATTYGKQADTILNKINYFANDNVHERLIRAELWYCIHNEMTNSLTDFFVRRTGRLYFDITSIPKYLDVVLEDIVNYLDWDEKRVESEKSYLNDLVYDATHYYEEELG